MKSTSRCLHILLVFFCCLFPIFPLGQTIHAQDGPFLPNGLAQITTENAKSVGQLTVIAPGGSDLVGIGSPELESFAKDPPGSNHWITSVRFSPDGRYLAAGSYDTSVRIWNMVTGERILTLLGHREMVNDVAFSPNGLVIASGSGAYDWYQDFSVRLWNFGTGAPLSTLLGHHNEVTSLSFSPDGTTVASASLDGTIRLWNVAAGKQVLDIQASNDWLRSVQFDTTGQRLLSAGNDNAVKLWDVQSGQLVRTMLHDDQVYDAKFSPDQTMIASTSRDGTLRLWETETGKLHANYRIARGEKDKDGFPIFPGKVAFSSDGSLLAVAFGNSIDLIDTQNGNKLFDLEGHTGSVYDLSFNPDGTLLASASFDGSIRLWGVPSVGH